ncbi:hypothetical protein [Paenibacillus paeoniae]|uniref:DUF2178 domain-containing protein n=1 Tax=Paenibacillus paeoniae TaxID=2292705 RepID=A0A371PPT0_9BACL|nr:hypothetical protein [Paenibacillus paeoniae]REK77719.1 hypothetical protein DX130_12210 [Paenibacillus paeoniae]
MYKHVDQWLAVSDNFNLFIGILCVIGFGSAIMYTIFLNKIGKKDEYSLQIRLNVTNKMFIALLVLLVAATFPDGSAVYFKQLIYSCGVLTMLVGALSSGYYYYRDFKS